MCVGFLECCISSGLHSHIEQIVKFCWVLSPEVYVIAHVALHLCIRIKRIRMVEHARLANHIGLPGLIHFGIVVWCARNCRPDDMCTIVFGILDEVCIACRSVVSNISCIRRLTYPEQETHRHFSLEHTVSAMQGIEREGLKHNLSIGVAHVNLTAYIELIAGTLRFSDNVPAPLIKNVINANLYIFRVKPRFFEFRIDARTVAVVGRVIDISRRTVFVTEAIFNEVHVFGSLTAHYTWLITFHSSLGRFVYFAQGHVLIFRFDLVRKHATAIGITFEFLTHGIVNLILQGRNIQTI